MKKIQISQINFPPPNLKDAKQTKEQTILEWLIEWVNFSINSSHIKYGDFLPEKSKLAKYLGVSIGTIQNAIRQAEDMGYFESRQSVGTVIKNPDEQGKFFEKTFSKKDEATILVKKYIIDSKLKLGNALPSTKELSKLLNIGENTLRLAINTLIREDIINTVVQNNGKSVRIYKKNINKDNCEILLSKTSLTNLTVQKMKDYISKNFNIGDKIASNEDFAKMFNVSIRTVNEASRILNEQNIILSRRGRYGTVYINTPEKIKKQKEREEKSLFMSKTGQKSLQESFLYSWEKTLDALKKYIMQNHGAGDKIPSMKELSKILNVSTNTIRHAISILCDEGYLITQRGKYGGVYILEMPQKDSETFRWLALNPTAINIDVK